MRTFARYAVAALPLCVFFACGTRSGGTARSPEQNLITSDQIRERSFSNAFEVVQALRANWLQVRGPDSFRTPSQIIVYFDDTRLGGVETLRSIAANNIAYIRHFDGITASGRWGLDHGQGVIYVSTRPLEAARSL